MWKGSMQAQKILCYSGNFILSLGKPSIIITGWEEKERFFCQRIVLFEDISNKLTIKNGSAAVKIQDLEAVYGGNSDTLLDSFMTDYGLKVAESDAFGIAVDLIQKRQGWEAVSLDFKFSTWDYGQLLLYLKWKFPGELDKIQKIAQQKKLKEMIELIKKIVVDMQ